MLFEAKGGIACVRSRIVDYFALYFIQGAVVDGLTFAREKAASLTVLPADTIKLDLKMAV